MSERRYVSMAQFGDCKICGQRQDLRCGACFKCADQVAGRIAARGVDAIVVHELWDSRNPENRWYVQAPDLERLP